ncbi:YggS family pyridoxal phosphate-dependent enzyme [Calidifontibacter sp. DB0510]|uniref:Pyridoxal phosphate homeostasis protein n=1 Tax=Metallococcus carri TaxID=1656884 RepID=A0A967B273_9MICO|nr:YggS family pyridoxal phosphate-dependent enzyme [Metallococcus carri]NHN56030.1 YggS family pyridoxal phosphate-dependent enzyme [Metallococcus carri]NOP37513.1 YggS family pyridoxal phosphate-dependent enzyme [Calidifontibacter sp. DB2511S]
MSGARQEELAASLRAVRERIDAACAAAGRAPADVQLVVITKYFPASDIGILAELGVTAIGENKDQEAGAKVAELDPDLRGRLTVHFVGQLQSNKAGHVAAYADVVQSVDRGKIARALQRGAERADRRLEVTIQVDLDGSDPGRGGTLPDEVEQLAAQIGECDRLRLRGVMAVAPRGPDPAQAFERLAEVSHRLREQVPGADWISAGMSGDLEQAIAAGATHLRVGSAILGSRPVRR